MNYCPNCGAKTVIGAKFCVVCGSPITTVAPALAPSSPTPPPQPSYVPARYTYEQNASEKSSNPLAIVGMVLGIISSTCLLLTPYASGLSIFSFLSIPGFIISLISVKKPALRGMSVTGIITSALGSLFLVSVFILFFLLFMSALLYNN